MTDNTKIQEIASQLITKTFDYDYIGIRIQEDQTNNIGDIITHRSFVWDDGNMSDERLNGICAIDINQAKYLGRSGGYLGQYIYILGSNSVECGNDIGEIIMQDAIVLDVIYNG